MGVLDLSSQDLDGEPDQRVHQRIEDENLNDVYWVRSKKRDGASELDQGHQSVSRAHCRVSIKCPAGRY